MRCSQTSTSLLKGVAVMPNAFTKLAVPSVLIVVLGLAACGESSQEKASKQVCSAVSEISTQINKLQSLTISSSFPAEAKASVEAIGKSITQIKDAGPNLDTARREELDAANKAFQTEIVTITKSVVSVSKSSNLQAALHGAEAQIKTALSTLAANYKKAFQALKC
jgi:hypothetical protein